MWKNAYFLGAQLDCGGDNDAFFDVLVLDERVLLRQEMLDDEVLLLREAEVDGVQSLEVGGLHILSLNGVWEFAIHDINIGLAEAQRTEIISSESHFNNI